MTKLMVGTAPFTDEHKLAIDRLLFQHMLTAEMDAGFDGGEYSGVISLESLEGDLKAYAESKGLAGGDVMSRYVYGEELWDSPAYADARYIQDLMLIKHKHPKAQSIAESVKAAILDAIETGEDGYGHEVY